MCSIRWEIEEIFLVFVCIWQKEDQKPSLDLPNGNAMQI